MAAFHRRKSYKQCLTNLDPEVSCSTTEATVSLIILELKLLIHKQAITCRKDYKLDSSTTEWRTGWPPYRVKIPHRKVWLTSTARVPFSNAGNIAERNTWTQSEFCTLQNSVRGQELPKICIYNLPASESDVGAVTKLSQDAKPVEICRIAQNSRTDVGR